MGKLIVLQAPPACGKSTWAREHATGELAKSWIIISKDDIRKMLGDYWVESREDLVKKIEWQSAAIAAQQGYNIIIDATNLRPKDEARWKNFAVEFDMDIEFKKWALPYSEAVKRDYARNFKEGELSVGLTVMDYFYNNFFPELKNQ